jgi:hypothetical protein
MFYLNLETEKPLIENLKSDYVLAATTVHQMAAQICFCDVNGDHHILVSLVSWVADLDILAITRRAWILQVKSDLANCSPFGHLKVAAPSPKLLSSNVTRLLTVTSQNLTITKPFEKTINKLEKLQFDCSWNNYEFFRSQKIIERILNINLITYDSI